MAMDVHNNELYLEDMEEELEQAVADYFADWEDDKFVEIAVQHLAVAE